MFNSIAKLFSYFHPKDLLISHKQQFQELLFSNQTQKTIEYIHAYPELINQPLTSGHYPIEIALSKKNIALAYHLMANEAHINLGNQNHLSVVDQLIMKNDSQLNKQFFGEVLGTIFSKTYHTLHALNHTEFLNAKSSAFDQLQKLSQEIERYKQILQDYPSNNLIKQIQLLNDDELKSFLQSQQHSLQPLEIFQTLLWAIFHHKNEAIESIYNVLGPKALTLQTTDLKNLYHIAVIANNPIIILRLAQWGLSIRPSNHSKHLNIPSPYHYAILNPSLTTFLALSHAGVPYPKETDLKKKQHLLLSIDAENVFLNPIELLILKAHINDPFFPLSTSKKLYLLFEMLAWGYELYADKSSSPFSQLFQTIRTITRTSFLCSNLIQQFSNITYKNIFAISSKMILFGSTLSFFSAAFSKFFDSAYQCYKYTSYLLLVRKIWNDLDRYRHNYLLRPQETIKNALYDQLITILFIKNITQDLDQFIDQSKRIPLYSLKHFNGSSSKAHCELEEITPFSHQNLAELSKRIANLSEQRLKCSIDKTLKMDVEKMIEQTQADHFIQTLIAPDYRLDNAGQRKFYRELAKRIHPDKCNEHYSSDFCDQISQNYFSQICAWFGKQ